MIIKDSVVAAWVLADANSPNKRLDSKGFPCIKRLMWEDATQEQREKLTWIKGLRGTYAFVHPTKEEEKEIWLDRQYHMRQMLYYILENYGIDIFNKVIERYKAAFDKYDVNTNIDFKHCEYAGQCDLFCPFYCGGCQFNDALDQTVVDI